MGDFEFDPAGIGMEEFVDNYPHRYRNEVFRSMAEVRWAKAFDHLGLRWEYEPLKFDMGPTHVSYCPDFRVAGLSIPDSDRALYVEIKRFPDEVNLTKYVRFTKWYNCDLLVLAHKDGGVLTPKSERYFLILSCPHCNTYECLSCKELPADDYKPPLARQCVCQGEPLERIVVRNYFLIQAGTIRKARVVLPTRRDFPIKNLPDGTARS